LFLVCLVHAAEDTGSAVAFVVMRAGMRTILGLVAAVGLISCTGETLKPAPQSPASSQAPADPSESPAAGPSPSPTTDLRDEARRVKANELGEIPILMYHRVHPGASGDYDLTPSEFRAELQRLWREGYVPVRVVDVVEGNLDVPAGKSPVVLTFDDSSVEQFGYTGKGKIDPDTAIGILLDFARKHEGFEATASLYVNQRPFNSSDFPKMLKDLHARGFELGNHTAEHRDLRASSPDEVRRQLALGKKVITDAVPNAEVATLSLPLGLSPRPERLAWSGKWKGIRYEHRGILLVGWKPAPSPFHRSFDGHAIPRIRSARQQGSAPTYGSEFWLDHLRKNPGERYISDGDPQTVAFPKKLRSELAPHYRDQALPY
jgi:peptidoglycan/xylan/chitin deacetylase (PgdA/CDA1 family)